MQKSPSLLFCIVMDVVGYLSYAVPGLGEIADVIWAPLSATIFAATFGGKRGLVGGLFNFIEEAMPGTDFIPSFTIMWFLVNKGKVFQRDKSIITVNSR